MDFIKKLLDILNMENWNKEDKSEESLIGFDQEKDQIISLLRINIENANILLEKAIKSKNRNELYECVNELEHIFFNGEIFDMKSSSIEENDTQITYDDIKEYDNKPFDLNNKFISDGNFTAIKLSDRNLDIAYEYLQKINNLIYPYRYLYENVSFPEEISVDYMPNSVLPISHLRLTPYTKTMRKSKYPLCLWLSNFGYYGVEYIYIVYFDTDGNIGKCDLSFHVMGEAKVSYETKIRKNNDGIYVSKINKTLYSFPYGTKTIYDSLSLEKDHKYMSKYDIERYAIECNAYVLQEERKTNLRRAENGID